MNQNFTTFAFTDTTRMLQERYGSRKNYAHMEKSGDSYLLTWREIDFIQSRDSFYQSTVGENGWPYVQYRGGPAGFLKVLDEQTIAYADFRGNKQYISTANMQDTKKVALILMDYPNKQRLKIWVEAEVHFAEDAPELIEKLQVHDYKAKIERAFVFTIKGYDWNCPQHITPRYTEEEILKISSQNNF